jgi:hypothetical protein
MKSLNIFSSVVAAALLAACGGTSSTSSDPVEPSSSAVIPESSSSVEWVESSSSEAVAPESSSALESSAVEPAADTVWNKANLTWYISWPDPGSEEWVREHNIISIHEKDFGKYKLKTFRLRQDGNSIDAVVYDKCADSDCDGCCTENAGELGFLIDVESYTCERLSGTKDGCDGVIEWTCLDCE